MNGSGARVFAGMTRVAAGIVRHPGIAGGLGILIAMVLAAAFFPLPHDPLGPDPRNTLAPPSTDHWFGTDINGFDVFSRTVVSALTDIPLAAAGICVSMLIGVPFGLFAGGRPGRGELVMRALDAFQAFPLLILVVSLVQLWGAGIHTIVAAIAIINAPRFIRLVRGEALSLRESRFVEAARAFGASPFWILFRHILPNTTGVILVQASIGGAHAVMTIAAMSFLGIGIVPPTPSWGSIIQAGARNIATGQWWIVVFPALFVFLAVGSLNLIADRLQVVLSRVER